MKKLIKSVLIATAAFTAASLGAAPAGSCEQAAVAVQIGSQKNVKLVNGYDPEDKSYTGDGVYYGAATLKRGHEYTLWINGSVDALGVSSYPRDTTEAEFDKDIWGPMADFQFDELDGVKYGYIYADDWDEDDPASWKYYIVIDGEIGAGCTLHLSEGIQSFATPGTEDNPTALTIADAERSTKKDFVEGSYWFRANLVEGRSYRIRVAGASGSQTNSVSFSTGSSMTEPVLEEDPDYAKDKNNDAWILRAQSTGVHYIQVDGSGAGFQLFYRSIPVRAPADHSPTEIKAGASASFVPGRLVADRNYADDVIDEKLYSVKMAKGERWCFETTGADRDLRMMVYDAKGKVLASNDGLGNGTKNVRCCYECSVAGTFYVGVCNPALNYTDPKPTAPTVKLTAKRVSAVEKSPDEYDAKDDTYEGASGLTAMPAGKEEKLHGPHQLSATDWDDCYVIGGRKDISYEIATVWASTDLSTLDLRAEVFTLSGRMEKVVASGLVSPGEGTVKFTATANMSYYVRISVNGSKGLDFPPYYVKATASSATGEALYSLTVNTKGADGTWSLGRENVKYPGGASVLVVGDQTVKFYQVRGFSMPPTQTVTVKAGETEKTIVGLYSDTADPKDDVSTGAFRMNISAREMTWPRTLFAEDKADWFLFNARAGYYYNFALRNLEGDAVMSIYRKGDEKKALVDKVTEVSALPITENGDYLLKVHHPTTAAEDSSYTLAATSVNVGAIKFSQVKINARKSQGTVRVTVNRTAREGKVRVLYGTCAGTAKPGVDYVPQNGELVWENNDSRAKTIEIKLIPELIATASSRVFQVQLKPYDGELEDGEYEAAIQTPYTEVTVSDTAARMPTAVRGRTVKTEDVPLETGTFTGLMFEDGSALTNGFPAIASVTFTAGKQEKNALSARVMVGGKTLNFKGDTWSAEESDAKVAVADLIYAQKIGQVSVTNSLRVEVVRGQTTRKDAWLGAIAKATMKLNVQDSRGNGFQEDIAYVGDLYRDNSKIQDYLDASTNAVGYYTVSLAPLGVSSADGVPAGNGYLTVTVSVDGGARYAGMLADGSTRPSGSAKIAFADDGSFYLPIYTSRSPFCFGGVLRFVKGDDGKGKTVYVVDPASVLLWNNDDPNQTYYGEEGWRIELLPVGGYFNTVYNLQNYYLTSLLSVGTADVTELPTELLASGYKFNTEVQPYGYPVSFVGNNMVVDRRTLAKKDDRRTTDLANSVNPCNISVRIARQTGLVTGSFSVWSEDKAGNPKEITGFRSNGVLLLSRHEDSPLDPDIASPGFFNQRVSIKSGTRSRNWNLSLPFDILAVDQGDPDWYADDWGE